MISRSLPGDIIAYRSSSSVIHQTPLIGHSVARTSPAECAHTIQTSYRPPSRVVFVVSIRPRILCYRRFCLSPLSNLQWRDSISSSNHPPIRVALETDGFSIIMINSSGYKYMCLVETAPFAIRVDLDLHMPSETCDLGSSGKSDDCSGPYRPIF